MTNMTDTIAALATPAGRGGIAIIRISGSKAKAVAETLLKKTPTPRYAEYSNFYDKDEVVLDQGIALFFQAPHSFTGEDVLELHGHGGPVICDTILREIFSLGIRPAHPGEFSERAFLNDKIDLIQAEAIADLIDSASEQAARSALRSLQGEFSKKINLLITALTALRIYVEAAIDFPEEEIDFLSEGRVARDLNNIISQLTEIIKNTHQGILIREGMNLVIIGKPNAGKSSLLNLLCNEEIAIVSDIPGTTRDILRAQIQIDGMPLHIIDTAGLRPSKNQIEQEGIRRARSAIQTADAILLLLDSTQYQEIPSLAMLQQEYNLESNLTPVVVAKNKIDLFPATVSGNKSNEYELINLSAKTGEGIPELKHTLKKIMGYQSNNEGNFIARRRHLAALEKAQQHLQNGRYQLENFRAGELLAEELREAQASLGEITGVVRADDLLGKIFSSFCIGK